jgi:hypothetical protein
MFSFRSIAFVLGLCLASASAQCIASWTQQSMVNGPSNRVGAEAVYDSLRGATVVFGGGPNGTPPTSETWELASGQWALKSTSGPSPRAYTAMAFDSIRGRVVLFGGRSGTNFGDTWEWDGVTWIQRAASGPPARWLHALVFDPLRGRTVLFGGLDDSGGLGGTWEWDGNAWSLVSTTGPIPRQGHAMAFDVASGKVLMHGGAIPYVQGSERGDTWTWDGQAWTQVGPASAYPRDAHAMVFSPSLGQMVMFGGAVCCYSWPSETLIWTGLQWQALPTSTSGPGRQDFAFVYDVSAQLIRVLFGQYGSNPPDYHWQLYIPAAGAGTPLGPQSASAVEWSTSAGGNGHRYEVVAASSACGVTWDQAHDAATAAGGHLATIESSAENLFVFGLINQPQYWASSPSNQDGPWIGGIQRSGSPEPSGGWGWVTSESFGYSAWATAPDNGCGGQDNRMNYWHPSSRSATWGDLAGAGCGSRRPKAFVVEYEPGLTCLPTAGFGVCAVTSTTGPSRLQIMNLPEGTLFGKTLISTIPAYPQGTGSFFGLNADLLTLQILVTPNAVGDPLTWTVSEKGVFPEAPFYFPVSLTAPFAGMTWDFMAVAVSGAGGIQLSSITRRTWQP